MTVGDPVFRLHQGLRRDEGRAPDSRAVHNDGVHPHQRVFTNDAAMQDGAVADMAVPLHHHIHAREGVGGAAFLNVGPLSDQDAAKIAAQAGQRADIAAGADLHVADQHRFGMDVA